MPGTQEWKDNIATHKARYDFARPYAEGRTVVDIACGVGYGSAILAQVATEVYGVDVSHEAIACASSQFPCHNVTYLRGEAHALGSIVPRADLVVSFETMEHLEEPDKFLVEVGGVLGAAGTLIVSVPNGYFDRPGDNPYHVTFITPPQFKRLLSAHFSQVRTFGQFLTVPTAGVSISYSARQRLKRLVPPRVRTWLRSVVGQPKFDATDVLFRESLVEDAAVLIGVCTGYKAAAGTLIDHSSGT